jgi:hypothetical protein
VPETQRVLFVYKKTRDCTDIMCRKIRTIRAWTIRIIKAGVVRIIRAETEAIIRAGQKGTVGIIRAGN